MTLSYEDYLDIPGLLAVMQPETKTLDEHQLAAFWAHSLLYGDLARRELRVLSTLLAEPLSRSRYDDALKRVRRGHVLYTLVLEADGLVRHATFQHQPHEVRFRLASSDPRQIGSWSDLTPMLARLPTVRLEAGVSDAPRLVSQLRAHVTRLGALAEQVELRLRQWLLWMAALPAACAIAFTDFLRADELLQQTTDTLAVHHPQTGDPAYVSQDERTFVTAHRALEAWFSFVAAALQDAIVSLDGEATPEQIGQAIDCLTRCTEVFSLCQQAIELPTSMTVADYLEFRHQLAGGSGKQSSQFRTIELRLGRRGPAYLRRIEDVLTEEMRAESSQPSLAMGITRLLEARGIFAPGASEVERAKAIAEQVYLPTAADTPHADLRELLEAAVALEAAWNLFGLHHLLMVERQTGKQGSMIASQSEQEGAQTGGAEPPVHRHSKPYLLDALSAGSIFADAWAARTFVTRRQACHPVQVG